MTHHAIGIDFGTTKTLVSHINPQTKAPETLRLGRGSDYMPTSIFIGNNGEMLYGDDADDMVEDSSNGLYLRGFKMHLGSDTPLHIYTTADGSICMPTAKDLVKHYLQHIKKQVEARVYMGERVSKAVITRPVNFTAAQCDELKQAALAAGYSQVEFTTEPEAAGLAFCSLQATHAFKGNALVIDWGGGTLDFALVTRNGDKVCTHKNMTDGDTTIGGEKFDERLWMYTDMQMKQKGIILDHICMMPKVRKGKEQLSVRTNTTLRLSHSGGAFPPLTIERACFNRMIEADIEKAVAKVKGLLLRIAKEHKPEMLLLVGGSSQIPLIKEKLEAACNIPAKQWHNAREAVALGAALTLVKKPERTISKRNAPENKPSKTPGGNELLQAASLGKTKEVKQLLNLKIPVNTVNNNGETALHLAVRHQYPEIVRLLLAAPGINLNKFTNNGATPLYLATTSQNIDLVKLLISARGIDVNKNSSKKSTPLSVAIRCGYDAIAYELLNVKGIDVNKNTPLIEAVKKNNTGLIKKIQATPNCDVNQKRKDKTTALYWAEINGNADIVKQLLAVPDIQINTDTVKGETSHDQTNAYMVKLLQEEEPSTIETHLLSVRNSINKQRKCKTACITQKGYGIALFTNGASWSAGLPHEFIVHIKEICKQNQTLTDVCVLDNGAWLVVHGRNGYKGHQIPTGLSEMLLEFNKDREEIYSVSFNSKGDFSIVTNEHFYSNNNYLQSEVKKYASKYGHLYSINHSENGWVACYEKGYCWQNVPQRVKDKALKMHAKYVRFNDAGLHIIAGFNQEYTYYI